MHTTVCNEKIYNVNMLSAYWHIYVLTCIHTYVYSHPETNTPCIYVLFFSFFFFWLANVGEEKMREEAK